MTQYTVNVPTLAKLLNELLKLWHASGIQCNGQLTMMTTFGYVRDTPWNMNFKRVTNKQTTH